jgi:hypothetical protein
VRSILSNCTSQSTGDGNECVGLGQVCCLWARCESISGTRESRGWDVRVNWADDKGWLITICRLCLGGLWVVTFLRGLRVVVSALTWLRRVVIFSRTCCGIRVSVIIRAGVVGVVDLASRVGGYWVVWSLHAVSNQPQDMIIGCNLPLCPKMLSHILQSRCNPESW